MPTYSYACTECDHRFDIFQSFADDALSVCSECSGKLRKLFNSVGIVFKGSGFYRTDSRGAAASAGETASPSDKKSDGAVKDGAVKDGAVKTASKSDSSASGSSSTAQKQAVAS